MKYPMILVNIIPVIVIVLLAIIIIKIRAARHILKLIRRSSNKRSSNLLDEWPPTDSRGGVDVPLTECFNCVVDVQTNEKLELTPLRQEPLGKESLRQEPLRPAPPAPYLSTRSRVKSTKNE